MRICIAIILSSTILLGGCTFATKTKPIQWPVYLADGRMLNEDPAFVPPKLNKSVEPDYPVEMKGARISGKVVLIVIVDEEGKVGDIRVVTSGGFRFDQSAIESVRKWKYTPATLAGEPVAVINTITITWRVD